MKKNSECSQWGEKIDLIVNLWWYHKISQISPKLRYVITEYPGAYYHVMNRGNRREDIFLADTDRKVFLAGLLPTLGNEKVVNRTCTVVQPPAPA